MHSAPCMKPAQTPARRPRSRLHPAQHACPAEAPLPCAGLCTAAPALLTSPALHQLRTPVTAGVVHLVMEVCNGPTLQRVLDKRGALSEPETRSIMRQLVDAIVHLHARRLKSSLPCSLAG